MFTSSVVGIKHSFTSTSPQVQMLTKVKGLVYSKNVFFLLSIMVFFVLLPIICHPDGCSVGDSKSPVGDSLSLLSKLLDNRLLHISDISIYATETNKSFFGRVALIRGTAISNRRSRILSPTQTLTLTSVGTHALKYRHIALPGFSLLFLGELLLY